MGSVKGIPEMFPLSVVLMPFAYGMKCGLIDEIHKKNNAVSKKHEGKEEVKFHNWNEF